MMEKNKEIQKLQEELKNTYKLINEKKEENDKSNILNDELIKEKQEKEEKINEYQNELNELYRVNNTHSQKMIELSNELEQKI